MMWGPNVSPRIVKPEMFDLLGTFLVYKSYKNKDVCLLVGFLNVIM